MEECKMLAPRPIKGGNKKSEQQPVWNELNLEGMINNSFLFEMTCVIMLKCCKVN